MVVYLVPSANDFNRPEFTELFYHLVDRAGTSPELNPLLRKAYQAARGDLRQTLGRALARTAGQSQAPQRANRPA